MPTKLDALPEKLSDSTLDDLKGLIEARQARREELSTILNDTSKEIGSVDAEIAKLKEEADIQLGVQERKVERDPITAEIITPA